MRPHENNSDPLSDPMLAVETASQRAARLLPGPLNAAEQAAQAAAIAAPTAKYRVNKARIAFGTAAVAVAVTMPDLSAGAMDSPYLLFELPEPSAPIDQPIWNPSVVATAPVYSSAMAAEQIAPSSLTFGNDTRFVGANQKVPLTILESEEDRFDLAFAEVAMPSLLEFAISQPLPAQGRADVEAVSANLAAPLRASLIDVPQITNIRSYTQSSAPGLRPSRPELDTGSHSGSSITSSVARTNESVAAAFAGAIDVSGGVRDSLPISGPIPGSVSESSSGAGAETAQISGAVPLPATPSGLSASRAAEAELVTRSRLDARINGVVTGSVDFQQRDGTIAIRLGSVVDLLRDRYSATELDQFAGAGALGAFVTLADLQAAGIPISYDPVYDEVGFGIDYDDAPQAGKVQMEQIGSPMVGSDRALIDQIPR